ncbi:MAG TPA: hypothetical protein VH352_10050 [Pseudonocardiaceae bacterium]|nr:hypothetical protein [Pseudonocardiaceae bacterium]
MRLRSGIGAGLVAVAIVAAVAVLRTPIDLPPDMAASQPATGPVVDARSRALTAGFLHTTLLPPTVRFADDPNTPPGFVFRRYVDMEVNHILARYTAAGLLVRTKDKAVLDTVTVTVWHTDGRTIRAADLATCDPDPSCAQRSFPDGTIAKVVRASSAASQAELLAAYLNGTLLTITFVSPTGAGIPLDDAALFRLAAIPGISPTQ